MENNILSGQTTPLTNSRRRYEKRTYTPLIIENPSQEGPNNVPWIAQIVRSLMINDSEFVELRRRLTNNSSQQSGAVNEMQKLATAISCQSVLDAASNLAAASPDDLRHISDTLAAIRTERTEMLTEQIRALHDLYVRETTPTTSPHSIDTAALIPRPSSDKHAAKATRTGSRGNRTIAEERIRKSNKSGNQFPAEPRSVNLYIPTSMAISTQPAMISLASRLAFYNGNERIKSALYATSSQLFINAIGSQLAERVPGVLSWSMVNKPDKMRNILDLSNHYATDQSDVVTSVVKAVSNLTRLQLLPKLFNDSLTQRPLQPIGLLHLERLEMTPLGVERGELTYSLPLAPNEKVTLAHREWAVHEEQFSEFIEDYLENFSQQGVAQTDDIAMSTSTQSSHDNSMSMGQPIAPSNGTQITSPVDTTSTMSSSVQDLTSKEESKSQSRTITATASKRTMKDHKISFTVTTVSGMEDFTAHLIENKHEDNSMRIDYFKRIRKWQSDLYRYGVRLTYDTVLPDPSASIRDREVRIQQITEELATEFQFDLLPSQISVNNWEDLANQYGVVLPAPPDQIRQSEVTQVVNFPTPFDQTTTADGSKWTDWDRTSSLKVTIPEGFQITNLNIFAALATWDNDSGLGKWLNTYAGQSTSLVVADSHGYCHLNWNIGNTQVPADGTITVVFRMRNVIDGPLKLTATVVPTESTMEKWRLTCWSIIRDSTVAHSLQHRNYLRERLSALQKDISNDDPIRLRRMEREAIMRSVLEWLFPGFGNASSVLSDLPVPASEDLGEWQQIMEYGEYIKFIQTAIDWDNAIVFLYPYFWDTSWNEQEKLFLNHPDPVHREFLRAGAARVIIAIQPGFEEDVVSLLEQGQMGRLIPQSRFDRVINDVHDANAAYAQTTHGSDSEDPREPGGDPIGKWTDYTPTSALDIEVTVQSVINQ
jgi:hypothetical protein